MKVSQQTQEERKRKIILFFDKKEEGYFSLYLYLIINQEKKDKIKKRKIK